MKKRGRGEGREREREKSGWLLDPGSKKVQKCHACAGKQRSMIGGHGGVGILFGARLQDISIDVYTQPEYLGISSVLLLREGGGARRLIFPLTPSVHLVLPLSLSCFFFWNRGE